MSNIYSIPQAAKKLGWSRWTLWKAVRNKQVPFRVLPGTQRAYLRDEDLEQIEANCIREAHPDGE